MAVLLDHLVEMPPAMADRVVAQAEGIPLYAVEIVRSMLDRGAIDEGDGRRRATAPFDDDQVPATLTAPAGGQAGRASTRRAHAGS